jgi:CHAT domain-containing protein
MGDIEKQLTIQDIIKDPFNSKMVTLSACNTGSGRLEENEGVISIGRAFIESGAQSIIMSSYKVPDKSSADIMISYYKNLKLGQSKSKALSLAKKEYVMGNTMILSHPYYWSAFTIQGNEDAIYRHPLLTFIKLLFFGLLIIILIILFRQKSKKLIK